MGDIMIKMRLNGTKEEIQMMLLTLHDVYEIVSVSKFYKDRNRDNYRIYLEVEVPFCKK